MLPDCSRVLIKKNSWGSMPPNPPSKLTAAPLDRQISVFSGKTQSHACYTDSKGVEGTGVGLEGIAACEGADQLHAEHLSLVALISSVRPFNNVETLSCLL